MTTQEIVETVIDVLAIVISWPVIILILVLLFRKQIIDVLSERLKSVSIGGNTVELFEAAQQAHSPELQAINRERIPQSFRSEGDPRWSGDIIDEDALDIDEDEELPSSQDSDENAPISETEAEPDELRQTLDDISKR